MKVLKTLNLIFGIFFLFLLLYYVFFPSALLSMIDKHTLTNVLIILTLYLTTIGTVTFMAYRLKLKAPNWGLFTVFCPFLAPIVLSLKPKILDSIRDFFKKKPREEKFRYKVDKIKSSGDTGELLKALGHKKEAYRLEAAKALINSDDQEVMEQFIHRLVHLDQNLRRFVMETISKIRRSSAVVPLLGLLNESGSLLKDVLAKTLGNIGDPRAVEPLISLYKVEKENKIRQAIIEALGKIGGEHALDIYISALQDEDGRLRNIAATAVKNSGLTRHPDVQVYYHMVRKEWEELASLGANAEKPMIQWLGDLLKQDEAERQGKICGKLIVTLGKLRSKEAVESIIPALNDSQLEVRICAAEVLGEIGGHRSVESLHSRFLMLIDKDRAYHDSGVLNDDRQEVLNMIEVLTKLKNSKSVDLLLSALEDSDGSVRKDAVDALAVFKDSQAVNPLIAILQNDADNDVRISAAIALGKIQDPSAIKPLLKSLNVKRPLGDIYQAIADALDKLGWTPDRSKTGIAYWMAKKDFSKCLDIDKSALDPILGTGLFDDAKEVVKAFCQKGGAEFIDPLLNTLLESERMLILLWMDNFQKEVVKALTGPFLNALNKAGWDLERRTKEVECPHCEKGNILVDWDEQRWKACGQCNGAGRLIQNQVIFSKGSKQIVAEDPSPSDEK